MQSVGTLRLLRSITANLDLAASTGLGAREYSSSSILRGPRSEVPGCARWLDRTLAQARHPPMSLGVGTRSTPSRMPGLPRAAKLSGSVVAARHTFVAGPRVEASRDGEMAEREKRRHLH